VSISPELGEQKEIRLPSGVVRYRERGSGPAIVFVHGVLVNGDLWRKVVPRLAGEFRCITPDWPLGSHEARLDSHAEISPPGAAKLISDFLEALGLEAVTLVGNDTGGALCQLVIASNPERIGRLVLTNCDAFENFPPRVIRFFLPLVRLPGALPPSARLLNWKPARRLLFGTLAKTKVEPEVLDSYSRPSLRRHVQKHLSQMLKVAGGDNKYTLAAAKTFPEFQKPVLIAWAPEDRFFTWSYARRLAQAFSNSRLERIEDSLTFVPEDQPERLATLIGSFMREKARVREPAGSGG
jgi:pimeloyl-ACP methyl ester carboxylesterase